MKPEIKQLLVAKLPEYRMHRQNLRSADCYCVLGVLCDLYRIETGQGEWRPASYRPPDYHFVAGEEYSIATLPKVVLDWAELCNRQCNLLSAWNDVYCDNFTQLAERIETEFEKVFTRKD